jgi:hypothetical protein
MRGIGRGLTLRGQLLCVLLGQVASDDAAADRADHGMVSRVVAGDPADDGALHASGRVRGSGGTEGERERKEGGLEFALFHRVFFCFALIRETAFA